MMEILNNKFVVLDTIFFLPCPIFSFFGRDSNFFLGKVVVETVKYVVLVEAQDGNQKENKTEEKTLRIWKLVRQE